MQRFHFIAIGGSAMHNLAIALKKKGNAISGSDDEIFEPSRSRLAKYGLLPDSEGWDVSRIHQGLDAVILGMHAKKDNPELLAAKEQNIPIYSFPEYLYEHAKNKKRIVVGGSHGKTTTTAMILHVLHALGQEVDYMVGAQLDGFETMVSLSSEAKTMILEGDEYLTSALDPRPKFHVYRPHTAVLTGVAWDHMNVFPTFNDYLEQFRIFIRKVRSGGHIYYNREDNYLKNLMINTADDVDTHSYTLPEYSTRDGMTYIHHRATLYPLQIFGKHNLLNMEAARLICNDLGIDTDDFYTAMASFKGASNRMEKMKESKNLVFFKDFAHAPSKVMATLNAVREQYPNRRLIALFELHTYSSLNKDFLPSYRHSLDAADEAMVFYSPHAIELKKLPYLDEDDVHNAFDKENLKVYTDIEALKQSLNNRELKNTAVLAMSSGNFGGINWEELFGEK